MFAKRYPNYVGVREVSEQLSDDGFSQYGFRQRD
jgi:hypothetical protein